MFLAVPGFQILVFECISFSILFAELFHGDLAKTGCITGTETGGLAAGVTSVCTVHRAILITTTTTATAAHYRALVDTRAVTCIDTHTGA